MKIILSILIFYCAALQAQTPDQLPIYTPSGTDAAIQKQSVKDKAYADSLFTVNAKQQNKTSDSVVQALRGELKKLKDETNLTIIKLPKDTLLAAQGLRFDSIGPGKMVAVPQFYWDDKTQSLQRNF